MKKILMGLMVLFAVNSVFAGEGKDWKSYYDNLLKGLKSRVQKKMESKNRISAVAAVRGAKQGSDADALYWKGGVSEKAQKKLADEKKAITDAVQLVVDGKLPEGKAALEKFIKDNPDSIYATEAKEALSNLPKGEAKSADEKSESGASNPAETMPAVPSPASSAKTDNAN